MSDRFFTSEPLAPGEFILTGPDAHHLATVRRFATGDRVTLFNGDGNEYPAEIISTDRKSAALNVLAAETVNRELPFELTIAAAMPKGDRGDFLIEKLVELGVTRFVPLLTERTIVQPKESRLEKLNQAVIEASKQCGRNRLMIIGESTKWSEFVKSATGWRAVLHPGGTPLVGWTLPTARSGSVEDYRLPVWHTGSVGGQCPPYTMAIGPEGGFTEGEVQFAEAAGWVRASLGPRILRVETAAIAAACALQ